MRRLIRRHLPVLSRVYGLQWADVVDMPPAEMWAYLDDLNELSAQQRG